MEYQRDDHCAKRVANVNKERNLLSSSHTFIRFHQQFVSSYWDDHNREAKEQSHHAHNGIMRVDFRLYKYPHHISEDNR